MSAASATPTSCPCSCPCTYQGSSIDFVTLGMFIIDDVELEPTKPAISGVLGGAGTYAAIGARILSPFPLSSSIAWIVDMGTDFPRPAKVAVESFATSIVLRPNLDRLTTRSWNGYDGSLGQKRAFRYLTPKKLLTADDLTPALLRSKSFHLICSPLRCKDLVTHILSRRSASACAAHPFSRPIFVWEPVPDMCTPDQLLNFTNVLPLVDICSPNHSELAALMSEDGLEPQTGQISTSAVERLCDQLLNSMPINSYSLVVRAGEMGCYLAKNGGRKQSSAPSSPIPLQTQSGHALPPDGDMEATLTGLARDSDGRIARHDVDVHPGLHTWIPAFHQTGWAVVDPTGGGNTFLGGLTIALARGHTIEEAAIWGSVSASFAIEQTGIPVLATNHDGTETWNGVVPSERFAELRQRLAT